MIFLSATSVFMINVFSSAKHAKLSSLSPVSTEFHTISSVTEVMKLMFLCLKHEAVTFDSMSIVTK